jgi:DNA-binding LytR/AlgR family response regulator
MNDFILLKWRNRRMTVGIDDICYVESYNRHLSVHIVNQTIEVVGKLSEIMTQLGSDFICIHKSFAVNMKYIFKIDNNGVTMNSGDLLPVSVRKKTQVVNSFDSFCEGNRKADIR